MSFLKNISDNELIHRIAEGDKRSLDLLFKRYYPRLCFFSLQFVKNKNLAEEVVSDIFLNIWLKRGRLKINISVKAYLYTAVRNQSLNYLKKKDLNYEDLEVVDKESVIASLSPDHFLIYDELKEEIENMIKNLPERRQLIFRMNRIDGLSYKEIAEILSISVNTVQNQMVEAVKFMTKQLPRIKKLFTLVLAFLIQ
ncbi:MAG: RNA polymerase sigma-70 factor [Bacteroidota bacterium]